MKQASQKKGSNYKEGKQTIMKAAGIRDTIKDRTNVYGYLVGR